MPDEPEVETKDLQEAIQDLREREKEEQKSSWTRYVGLSTAILAVFAAIGALQAGSLVNEALINRVKASDTWNEYQSSREKAHLYTVVGNSLIDERPSFVNKQVGSATPKAPSAGIFRAESHARRIQDYSDQIERENKKAGTLTKEAKTLEEESDRQIRRHEMFAYSVALIQVAIALGAVSALTKVKSVWFLSMACGAAGIVYFLKGFIG